MKAPLIITVLAAILFACNPAETPKFPGQLGPGKVVEGELAAHAPDTFRLDLGPKMYIYGVADQLTVDVVVTLFDSNGLQIGLFDGPARGPETFFFETDDPGEYLLVIAPFKEESGRYTLALKQLEPVATDPAKRADQLFAPYTGKEVPGGVAMVRRNGKIVFLKAYGMSNLTYGVPFTTTTPSNIGSVSKQFTAMAILLLEQQGKLSLGDDVRKYIPELPDLGRVVTLRNMLNHTNGLREVYNLMPMTGWKMEDQLRREEIIEVLKRQKELQSPPGEEYNYNNSAFIMLAEIVERITGEKFPQWMAENVFGPLGMGSTVVRTNPLTIVPEAAMGYTMDSIGYREEGDLWASYGAGGIYTTAEDLNRWLGNFRDAKLGGGDLVTRLVTPDTLNNGDTMTYALGIGVGEFRGLKDYAHGGADLAHRAMLVCFPTIDGGVAVLSNNAGFPSDRIAFELAETFFASELGPEEKVKPAGDSAGVVVPERLLKAYAGKYRIASLGVVMEYKLEEGGLIISIEGQPESRMIPRSDSLFAYKGVDATVVFHLDAKGKVTDAVHSQGGQKFVLLPMEPYVPSADQLRELEGRYYCDELETFYNLELRDSTLFLLIRNTREIKLSPVEEDSFKGDVFFINQVDLIRDEKGGISGFAVSNGRTRGILFKRT
jgi:CubicO group peptidase (beta-lactamase class C family)